MNDPLKMSSPTTFAPTGNAISLRALQFGAMPSGLPDGPMIAGSGPAPAHASRSRSRGKRKALETTDIFGLSGSGSSPRDNLYLSLANRLRQRTDSLGSTLFSLTWKRRTTPSGRSIFALRASVPRTSANASTLPQPRSGWPTPNTSSGGPNIKSTPTHMGGMDLDGAATLANWATPSARDWKGGKASQKTMDKNGRPLNEQAVNLAGGQPARLTASGEMLTGSSAGMESGGQLNPALPRWLMALPPEWDESMVTAMQSSRKPRKSSSKPTEK